MFSQSQIRNLALILALSAQPLLGCDLCSIYDASRAQGEMGSGFLVGVAEQFTHFGTLQMDGEEVPNPLDQRLDSSISQVFAGYHFNDRFGLQLNLPVIYRSFRRPDGLGGIEHGSESGIGDLSLLGNFVAYRKLAPDYTITWGILGGMKFPTGSSARLEEEFNEIQAPVGPPSGIHGHDLTLGSGSLDGIIGSRVEATWRRGFASVLFQYAIRSEGDHDYRFADDLTWAGGPGYHLFMEHDFTLGLQAVISGEYKGLDRFQGAAAADTGMTAVYVGPQVNFTWQSSLSAQLGLDIPVSIDNTSLQIVPDYRLRAALLWHF